MSMKNCAVILAAGEGNRMKRKNPKALAPVLFKPMLQWVLDSAKAAGIERLCVVTGHLHEQVEQFLAQYDPTICTVYQPQRQGTGHAVMMAADFLRSNGGNVLILNGDAPFISPKEIQKAFKIHCENENAVTVISAELSDPTGYGRIVRDPKTGRLSSIVEQKDASAEIQKIQEINSGAYWFQTEELLGILSQIRNDNTQGEYYLTDAVRLLIEQNREADACKADSAEAVLGANDCLQLAKLNQIARKKILHSHLLSGTDIPCSDGVIIGPDVVIGSNVSILPGTILRGRTSIGANCVIGPNTVLTNCTIGEGVTLNSVQCSGCTIESGQTVAPYTVIIK